MKNKKHIIKLLKLGEAYLLVGSFMLGIVFSKAVSDFLGYCFLTTKDLYMMVFVSLVLICVTIYINLNIKKELDKENNN